MKKIILLSILILNYIFGIASVSAIDSKISVEKDKQVFLDFTRYSSVEKLYDSGKLSINLLSDDGIALKKEGKKIIFTLPYALQTGTGILEISYGDISRNIDLILKRKSITYDMTDFNISPLFFTKHLQEKSLSCESAAASDILSTILGSSVSESDVIARLPKSDYYRKVAVESSSGYIWGNPNQGFVGYIDHESGVIAKQKNMTGYGVYEKPIADVYQSYGLKTQIMNSSFYYSGFGPDEHLRYILQQLSEKKMVQLWGDWCTLWKYEDGTVSASEITTALAISGVSGKNECYNVQDDRNLSWSYIDESGNNIQYNGLDGQHAFILLGWKGERENPTHIRVWDTDTGFHEYETIEWMRKWKKMSYRSLIIE